MEQLKVFLTNLKKYHFWVISVVVLAVTVVCWWLATSSLAGQFQSRKDQINSAFTSVNVQPNSPNAATIGVIREQEAALAGEVYRAWQILYSEQKEKNPIPAVLGEQFKQQFESLKPGQELSQQNREIYMNIINKYFPLLLQIVDIRRSADEGAAAPRPGRFIDGMGGFAAPTQKMLGIVDWPGHAQLMANFNWQSTPSTLEIILAQEDLWVYKALLEVIRNANEGATSQMNAAVKAIHTLDIGRGAALVAETILPTDEGETVFGEVDVSTSGFASQLSSLGAAGGGRPPAGGPPGGGPPGAAVPGAGEMTSRDRIHQEKIEGRYVGNDGKPLSFQREHPYANHPQAEFKMMPIHMTLTMDQRRIPKLLVECANSNMPIRVDRVQITKSRGNDLVSSDMEGDSLFGGGGIVGGMGGPGGGQTVQEATPHDVPVDIHGVIYIFNPPDREKLGTGAASQEKPAEPAAPAGGTSPPVPPPAETPLENLPAVPAPGNATKPAPSSTPNP